jgi:ABC-type lipoprotein export system ATPase subunit
MSAQLLSLQGVHKSYTTAAGRQTVLRGVDFSLHGGEIVAVVGPSGCGKSTLLKVAGGLLAPDLGQARIMGQPVGDPRASVTSDLRARYLGFVFQQHNLVPFLSIEENVRLGLRFRQLPRAALRMAVAVALDFVGLAAKAKATPDQLSGGEQQRAAVARVLAAAPPIVLCDEPTGSVDEQMAAELFVLLKALATEHQRGVAMVTHNLRLAAECTRRCTLRAGTIDSHA